MMFHQTISQVYAYVENFPVKSVLCFITMKLFAVTLFNFFEKKLENQLISAMISALFFSLNNLTCLELTKK